jgi:hypothetical protein
MHCPDNECSSAMVINQGPVVEMKTRRTYFLDYPCDLKPGEKVTFILNLHGAGSIGNWQRHYFPAVDLKEKYRLVIATPTAATDQPTRRWAAEADDAHLQNITELVFDAFGRENIKSFWLAGHSQGGLTSRRIVCSEYFASKVDGFLSLSGGRINPPGAPPGTIAPRPAAAAAAAASARRRGRRRVTASAARNPQKTTRSRRRSPASEVPEAGVAPDRRPRVSGVTATLRTPPCARRCS